MPFTPIQQLKENFNNNNLFIKRDDLFPISFGGNKARKAVFFFQDMEKKKSDSIVTYGVSSSNHCRVVANIAAAKGIPCYIISPIESSSSTANKKLVQLFNAFIIYCPLNEVKNTIDNKIKELKKRGYNPYFIQGGGHGNIGTQAYVKVYEEIREYEKKFNIHFDYIFHTSGTGTTQAGLICGKQIYNDNRKIVGISNARRKKQGSQVILESVNSYLNSIDKKRINPDEVIFIDDYILNGYGTYNNRMLEIIKEVLIKEGIPLDTTYTGKAYWGMTEYIKKYNIQNKKILFIHTGGTPLFFDDLGELYNG